MKTTATKQKVTISLDSDVYEGLIRVAGPRGMGAYLSLLTRPLLANQNLDASYAAMAADEEHEKEAREWLDAPIDAPLPDDDFSSWQK